MSARKEIHTRVRRNTGSVLWLSGWGHPVTGQGGVSPDIILLGVDLGWIVYLVARWRRHRPVSRRLPISAFGGFAEAMLQNNS